MTFAALIPLMLSLGLTYLTFRASVDLNMHWSLALLVAAIPFAASFFLGYLGLVLSAMFTAAMVRASA